MPDGRADAAREELERSTRRWMWAGLVLMGLFFLAFPLYRVYEPTRRAEARVDQTTFLAAQGAELFEGSCASCHGVAGSGAIAPAIGAKEFLESADDVQISQLIAVGVPGSEMVAYSNDFGGPMTNQEITAVTTYLRSLEEDAKSKPNWRTPLEDENLTADELYLLACSRCHGADRMGVENVGPDISLTSFTMQESDDFLIGRIRDGYKAMPRFGRVLTQQQILAVVGYLRGLEGLVTTTTIPPTTQPGDTTGTTSGASGTTTTTGPPNPSTDDILALGQEIFNVTAGGVGCQDCHGLDGKGSPNGPNIIGSSQSALRGALGGGVPDMDFSPRLSSEEIDAVYAYMQFLTAQANP